MTMVEVAPGFRFYPTEEELLSFYLHKKLEGKTPELHRVIPIIDIYQHEPWHLPKLSGELCHGDTEQWFFFTPRQEREVHGGRPKRTTASGYWKATGAPGYVYSLNNRVIGVKRNMVFYKGKAPTGRKTKWKMNEYQAIEEEEAGAAAAAAASPYSSPIPKSRREFSLCRVYVISGSFRAFDRRPAGDMMTQYVNGDWAATTSQNTNMEVEKRSLERSYSGGDHVDLPGTAAGSDNLQVFDELEPLWEWGQLEWL